MFPGIFEEFTVYKFHLMNGDEKVGQVSRETWWASNGEPMTLALIMGASPNADIYIPWPAVAYYERLVK